MRESGPTEAVPFACISAVWGQRGELLGAHGSGAAAWLVTRWQGLGSFLGALRAEIPHLGAGTFDGCDNLVY